MYIKKRIIVNYDTAKQYLIFNWTNFWYSCSFGVTWHSNLGCAVFDKWILPLMRSRPTLLYRSYLYLFILFFGYIIIFCLCVPLLSCRIAYPGYKCEKNVDSKEVNSDNSDW